MDQLQCDICHTTIDETQKEWDEALKTGKCPVCRSLLKHPVIAQEARSVSNRSWPTDEERATGNKKMLESEAEVGPKSRRSHNAVATFVGACGVFMFGAASLLFAASFAGLLPKHTTKEEPPLEKMTVAEADEAPQPEFKLIQLGEFRRDQFLIDQRSGRIWRIVCSGEVSEADCKGMNIWEEMYVMGVTPPSSFATVSYRLHLEEQTEQESKKATATSKKKQ